MRILVSNDDGIDAPGLQALVEAVRDLGDLYIVAPTRNYSGASSSLTLADEIVIYPRGSQTYAVDGTPTDCVHVALTGDFLPARPDLIVSGINDGANMGDDTIYSGTVAAAVEGHLFDIPAFAFSIASKPAQHFTSGAAVARRLVRHFCYHRPPGTPLYNVNIPDVPADQLGELVHTRLGRRHVAKSSICCYKKPTAMAYRIGEAGAAKDDAPDTDFYAVNHGQVSVTPLMIDLTAADEVSGVGDWLAQTRTDETAVERSA